MTITTLNLAMAVVLYAKYSSFSLVNTHPRAAHVGQIL